MEFAFPQLCGMLKVHAGEAASAKQLRGPQYACRRRNHFPESWEDTH